MDLAHALPRLSDLDAKRIAATSLAIAVHVAVLMLLMLPAQVAPVRTVVETPMVVQEIELEEPPPPPPPPEPRTITRRDLAPVLPTPVATENLTPRAVDPYVESVTTELPPEDIGFPVDPPPAFAQIRADLSPPPPYPARALSRKLTGVVTLRVLVDASGRPVEATVETSSGATILDEAALKFVLKRWHFVPATQGGQAVPAYALVPISFELR